MPTINIDLNLALMYVRAEIARLKSEPAPPFSASAKEILQRIRTAVQVSHDELTDVELRRLVLNRAFDHLRVG